MNFLNEFFRDTKTNIFEYIKMFLQHLEEQHKENIKKDQETLKKIFEGFWDEFAFKVKWNKMLRYEYHGNRKKISYTADKNIMYIRNNYIKNFFKNVLFWTLSWLFLYTCQVIIGPSPTLQDIKKDTFLVYSLFILSLFIVYAICVLTKRALKEKNKITIHKNHGTITMENVLGEKEEIHIWKIHAIQIIRKVAATRKHAYNYYEVNLVLSNTERRNIINNNSKNNILNQAEELWKYIEKPVWNGIEICWKNYLEWSNKILKN